MSNTKARKLKIIRTSTQPLRLEPGEAVHVGVDVHKVTYSVALYSDARGVLTTWVQPARPELLLQRLRPFQEATARVVYEAGPTGFGLARRLRAEGFKAQVIAPSKLLASVGPESKSDRLDCRRLAQLSAKDLLHPVRVPSARPARSRLRSRASCCSMGSPSWRAWVTGRRRPLLSSAAWRCCRSCGSAWTCSWTS
jgi:transposase